MWVSDYRSNWLVGQIGDHWLGLLLAWASDCKVFFGFRVVACGYFKFLGFFFFFFYMWILIFFGFIGLIFWRIRWRKGILNEFLHVYLLRKCNKRKENIDYFNCLGNLHVLSQRT